MDLSDIRLPWHQDEMLDEVVALTTAPVVSVVVCGRAHVLTHVIGQSAVTIWVGYAGQYGPQAVADVLIDGAGLPGRLPVTLPAHPAAIPVRYNDRQSAPTYTRMRRNRYCASLATEPVLGWSDV